MAEYIELEVAVKAFNNFDAGRADSPPCTLLTPDEFAEYLYEIPVADVAPVIRATWVLTTDVGPSELYHCSRCGREEVRFGKSSIDKQYPYCHCGAKMDGGVE